MYETHNGEEIIPEVFDVDSMSAEERMKAGAIAGQVRETKGMTRVELAEAASIDRKTLRTLESGSRAPQPDVLKRVLEALGLPQRNDFDLRYGEQTRSFIASVAPIFDQLPTSAQVDAQHDVVVLLTGKLARASHSDSSGRLADVTPLWQSEAPIEEERAAAKDANTMKRRKDDSEFFS